MFPILWNPLGLQAIFLFSGRREDYFFASLWKWPIFVLRATWGNFSVSVFLYKLVSAIIGFLFGWSLIFDKTGATFYFLSTKVYLSFFSPYLFLSGMLVPILWKNLGSIERSPWRAVLWPTDWPRKFYLKELVVLLYSMTLKFRIIEKIWNLRKSLRLVR